MVAFQKLTKISEGCFQHHVESVPQRFKTVLKIKRGSNLTKWSLNVDFRQMMRHKGFKINYMKENTSIKHTKQAQLSQLKTEATQQTIFKRKNDVVA